MKKSRPALVLSALVPAASLDSAISTVLRETTTIGVRFDEVSRRVLERRSAEVQTRYGTLAIKLALLGDEVVNAAPEYEPCRVAAAQHGVPLKRVFAEVVAAWRQHTSAQM